MRLGQPVPTLSGGEAQRLKIAGFLAEAAQKRGAKGKLLLFDEPTTGLHFEDIAKLLRAFGRLLDIGHSLLVIEHNLDVIAASDWIIDLGPEGGHGGGAIVCAGTPEQVRAHATSHTGAGAARPCRAASRLRSRGRRAVAAPRAARRPAPRRRRPASKCAARASTTCTTSTSTSRASSSR